MTRNDVLVITIIGLQAVLALLNALGLAAPSALGIPTTALVWLGIVTYPLTIVLNQLERLGASNPTVAVVSGNGGSPDIAVQVSAAAKADAQAKADPQASALQALITPQTAETLANAAANLSQGERSRLQALISAAEATAAAQVPVGS